MFGVSIYEIIVIIVVFITCFGSNKNDELYLITKNFLLIIRKIKKILIKPLQGIIDEIDAEEGMTTTKGNDGRDYKVYKPEHYTQDDKSSK